MIKAVLTLCILVGSSHLVWADDLALADIPPSSSHAILAATVKAVTWADPVKGTKSEIIVIDAQKKISHILVTSTTTLWDKDAKAIMPETIVARCKVNVIYLTSPEGINIAKSIKILN